MIFYSIKEAAKATWNFQGRSERLEHWAFLLFSAICVAVFQVFSLYGIAMIFPLNWLFVFLFLWIVIANTSLMVRRLHDQGMSGFWLTIFLAPLTMMILSAQSMSGLGMLAMGPQRAELLFTVSKGVLALVIFVFGLVFSKSGDPHANRFGPPT